MDNTTHRNSLHPTFCAISFRTTYLLDIVIYPVDSAIQYLNNPCQRNKLLLSSGCNYNLLFPIVNLSTGQIFPAEGGFQLQNNWGLCSLFHLLDNQGKSSVCSPLFFLLPTESVSMLKPPPMEHDSKNGI